MWSQRSIVIIANVQIQNIQSFATDAAGTDTTLRAKTSLIDQFRRIPRSTPSTCSCRTKNLIWSRKKFSTHKTLENLHLRSTTKDLETSSDHRDSRISPQLWNASSPATMAQLRAQHHTPLLARLVEQITIRSNSRRQHRGEPDQEFLAPTRQRSRVLAVARRHPQETRILSTNQPIGADGVEQE